MGECVEKHVSIIIKNNFGKDGQKIFETDKFVLLSQTVKVT